MFARARAAGLALTATLGLAACKPARFVPWSAPAASPATLRHLAQGDVLGGEGRYGSHAWLGLPFAAPPLGELRWRAPHAPAAWQGTREALRFGSACPQYTSLLGGLEGPAGAIGGDEDCLTLNVWAPRFAPDAVPGPGERLPVLFWIHGGGNSLGTASIFEGGRLAAENGTIVVTAQYRLGPLGWFRHRAFSETSADPLERSGNFGILDLLAALRWVRENVGAFGGDPGNVTIFGESAGAMNTFALLVAPAARGLFQRAIVESGGMSETTPEEAEHFTDDPVPGDPNSSNEVAARLLIARGDAKDRAEAKQQLATLPAAALAAKLRQVPAAQLLRAYGVNPRLGMIDLPLVIGEPGEGALLPPGPWLARFAHPDTWNQVPVILGSNRDELRLFLFMDPHCTKLLFGFLPRSRDAARCLSSAAWATRGWKAKNVDAVAAAMRGGGATDVYAYRFDWRDEPTILGSDLSQLLGASHGFELPFVFGHFDLGPLGNRIFDPERKPRAEALSAAMRGYWTTFARTGDPGQGGRPDLPRWTAWDERTPASPRFLRLDIPAEGGIRMSSAAETTEAVVAGIDADPNLPTQLDRCRVYKLLTGFTDVLSKAAYVHAGKLGCEAYPLAAFPWDQQ